MLRIKVDVIGCVLKADLKGKSVIFSDIPSDSKNSKSPRNIGTKLYFANSRPYEETTPQLTTCKDLSWFHPEIEVFNAEHPDDGILE